MNVLILDDKIYLDTHKTILEEKAVKAKKSNPDTKIKWFFLSKMDYENSFEGKRKVLRNHIEKLIMLEKI